MPPIGAARRSRKRAAAFMKSSGWPSGQADWSCASATARSMPPAFAPAIWSGAPRSRRSRKPLRALPAHKQPVQVHVIARAGRASAHHMDRTRRSLSRDRFPISRSAIRAESRDHGRISRRAARPPGQHAVSNWPACHSNVEGSPVRARVAPEPAAPGSRGAAYRPCNPPRRASSLPDPAAALDRLTAPASPRPHIRSPRRRNSICWSARRSNSRPRSRSAPLPSRSIISTSTASAPRSTASKPPASRLASPALACSSRAKSASPISCSSCDCPILVRSAGLLEIVAQRPHAPSPATSA